MNSLHDYLDQLATGHIPTGVLLAAAVILLLGALKVGRGLGKFVMLALALAAIAGAMGWHFHQSGRI